MKSLLFIDWVSYYGKVMQDAKLKVLTERKNAYGTRVFEVSKTYFYQGVEVCNVLSIPRSSLLPAYAGIIKFSNSLLYRSDFAELRTLILHDLQFEILSFNRLDIAVDFNYFDNGINGHQLIKKFVNSEYLHNGRGDFSIIGQQKWECNFDYLRLGSRSSKAVVYCYNKTKELNEVKDKAYIRECWKNGGLDTKKDVWRVEISLRSEGCKFVDNETGEEILDIEYDFHDRSVLQSIYKCKIKELFEFKVNNGTKNKTRMKNVNLFGDLSTSVITYKGAVTKDSGKRERMLIKSLNQYAKRYTTETLHQAYSAQDLRDNLINQCGMQEWFEQKREIWENEE